MTKKRFLIVGAGGREAIFATKLATDVAVYAVIDHANPTIVECTQKSGGQFLVGTSKDAATVVKFACQHRIDYAFINSDEPLANGIVDHLMQAGIATIGGSQAATRIEWDKVFAMEFVHQIAPQQTPFYRVVDSPHSLSAALQQFKDKGLAVVVKPQGLTGGKGVKVMPIHLKNYRECEEYAQQLLAQQPPQKVLICQKLEGREFTLMGITDGINLTLAPATYDYPYRFDGNTGPGTGGMGCYTQLDGKLDFLSDADITNCRQLMQKVIDKMRAENLHFNGVLNGGFFKTPQGIFFMEFNSRFGDPESINVLMLLQTSFSNLLIDLYHQQLSAKSLQFTAKASVVKYLVAKEYPAPSPTATQFTVDKTLIEQANLSLFMGACIADNNNNYQTLKKSRVLAIGGIGNTIPTIAHTINTTLDSAISNGLEYRRDIGLTT